LPNIKASLSGYADADDLKRWRSYVPIFKTISSPKEAEILRLSPINEAISFTHVILPQIPTNYFESYFCQIVLMSKNKSEDTVLSTFVVLEDNFQKI
jgi:hypothetical protein